MIGWTQNDTNSGMHMYWTKISFAIFLPLLPHPSAFKVILYGWYLTKTSSLCNINFFKLHMYLNKKLTIAANVDGSDTIVANLIDRINFAKRNASFMMSWYPKYTTLTFCMICQFVSLKWKLRSGHYFSCNACSEIFTCFQLAFDKYLIALLQKTF